MLQIYGKRWNELFKDHKEVYAMPKVSPLGKNSLWKKEAVKTIQNCMNNADITPRELFQRKVITKTLYYNKLKNAGRFTLQELKDMEQAGVKFSDADILRIFGRIP